MSAMYAANHLKGVTAIISMTESGRTALMTSRISSGLPIFAMSRHERTLNLTSLYRGVTPVHFDSAADGVVAASEAVNLLRDKGYLVSGDSGYRDPGRRDEHHRLHQYHAYPNRRVIVGDEPDGASLIRLTGRVTKKPL
ncbi:pyruvate kinase [Citrobacter koseri]|uniref:Pyruvate kinase n=1 Tax=Citrobacter koseri TaxID=545 RepID=A0A447UGN7_CITKO|nr:pyruvate kinase [Citrobacter koseri]